MVSKVLLREIDTDKSLQYDTAVEKPKSIHETLTEAYTAGGGEVKSGPYSPAPGQIHVGNANQPDLLLTKQPILIGRGDRQFFYEPMSGLSAFRRVMQTSIGGPLIPR